MAEEYGGGWEMTHDLPLGMARLEVGVDHVRGGAEGRLIVEYGDYECPYSRRAFREVERVESQLVRVRRDVESGVATGEIFGTPTMFIDGVVGRGSYDAASLLQEVTVS
jgi:protein-disulfide isomerase